MKNTIYWVIFAAFVFLINVNKASQNTNYFKSLLVNNLKIIIIIEFIVNFYTFNFVIELLLFPIITFLVLIEAFTGNKDEYKPVNKIANYLLGIIGTIGIVISIANIISNYHIFWTWQTLKEFILPIILAITFIPFLYTLALYREYETTFIRIDIFMKKNPEAIKYAKKQILKLCNINLWELKRFVNDNKNNLFHWNDIDSITRIIEEHKMERGEK